MRNTCSLCGGKLKGGICTECGMDNRKSDDMYRKQMNRTDCTNQNLSHVHDNGKVESYQMPLINQPNSRSANRDQKQSTRQQTQGKYQSQSKQTQKPSQGPYARFSTGEIHRPKSIPGVQKSQKKFAVLTVLFIVVFMWGVISLIANNYNETGSIVTKYPEIDFDIDEDWENFGEYAPFAGLEEELNPVGELWEQEIPAGMYVVGVDIPEGEYILTGKEGSSFGIFDNAHGLAVNESFGTEEYEIVQADGVALFEGAVICVDGFYPVTFYTDNAQTQNMTERTENPLTESLEINGEAVAKYDFPEGTYDIYAEGEGFGSFWFEIQLERQDYTVPFRFSTLMEENPSEEYPEYCSVYKNVVLPASAVVSAEDCKVRLVPSQGITTEDYLGFYDNVY